MLVWCLFRDSNDEMNLTLQNMFSICSLSCLAFTMAHPSRNSAHSTLHPTISSSWKFSLITEVVNLNPPCPQPRARAYLIQRRATAFLFDWLIDWLIDTLSPITAHPGTWAHREPGAHSTPAWWGSLRKK